MEASGLTMGQLARLLGIQAFLFPLPSSFPSIPISQIIRWVGTGTRKEGERGKGMSVYFPSLHHFIVVLTCLEGWVYHFPSSSIASQRAVHHIHSPILASLFAGDGDGMI